MVCHRKTKHLFEGNSKNTLCQKVLKILNHIVVIAVKERANEILTFCDQGAARNGLFEKNRGTTHLAKDSCSNRFPKWVQDFC